MKKHLFFAFDIMINQSYAERELGEIEYKGTAELTRHKLDFRKNYDKGYAKPNTIYTGDLQDHVIGKVYGISSAQLKQLKTKITKNFHLEVKTIEVIFQDTKTDLLTLVPAVTKIDIQESPLDWYMQIMIDGLQHSALLEDYAEILKIIPVQIEPSEFRAGVNKEVMNYKNWPHKFLNSSIGMINDLDKGGNFMLHLPNHAYHKRKIRLKKAEKGFEFDTTVKIQLGEQHHGELVVKDLLIEFQKKRASNLYVNGQNFLVRNIQYDSNFEKHLHGSISGIGNLPKNGFTEKYLRMVIPITNGTKDLLRDFEYHQFIMNGKPHKTLIKLPIKSQMAHFYHFEIGNRYYIGIDLQERSNLFEFSQVATAILLTYALLKGQFLTGESYIIGFEEAQMKHPIGCYYQQMNDPIFGLEGVFTTNGFTGIDKRKLDKDENGNFTEQDLAKINEGMDYFPSSVYANLCNLILSDDKIFRALIQLIYNKNATLEIKIPVQYVALETITAAFVTGGNKALKPIEDDKLAGELLKKLDDTLEQFQRDHNFDEDQIARLSPIKKKIITLNSPPNADKLSESFRLLGYKELSTEEKKVLKLRNSFLHGSSVKIKAGTEDYGFKELFDISLRLHFLLSVLLLKKAGFNGKVINYVKLYEHITEVITDEEPLVKI